MLLLLAQVRAITNTSFALHSALLFIGMDSTGVSTTVIATAANIGAVALMLITITIILFSIVIAKKIGKSHSKQSHAPTTMISLNADHIKHTQGTCSICIIVHDFPS